jgi:hypothetical protein
MKTKRFLIFGLPVLLLALGLIVSASLTLAGCGDLNNESAGTTGDGNNGGNNGNNSDNIELDLPPLEEATTGQPTYAGTVSNSDVVISDGLNTPDSMPDALDEVTDDATGVTLSIADGVFSFTLPEEPTDAKVYNSENDWPATTIYKIFGEPDLESAFIDEPEAELSMVEQFSWRIKNINYRLSRKTEKSDSHGGNNSNSSEIVYVYASEDVVLSRAAQVVNNNINNNANWGPVNLELEAGWNLVQIDKSTTWNTSNSTSTTEVTVKIADKNVPWMLRGYVASTNRAVRLTDIPFADLEKSENQQTNPRLGVLVMEEMPESGAAPTGVAFYYRILPSLGTSGSTVTADFELTVLNGQPSTNNTGARWTGTGDYYVALIPNVETGGFKYQSGKVYAEGEGESPPPVKVTFNDDLGYVNGAFTLELSYDDFIAHDFSYTE